MSENSMGWVLRNFFWKLNAALGCSFHGIDHMLVIIVFLWPIDSQAMVNSQPVPDTTQLLN